MKALQVLVCSIVCFVALAAATQRRAEAAYWHTTASGCQWDGSGVSLSPSPTASLAGAQFPSTVTGDITLFCPITVVNLDGVTPHMAFYAFDDNVSNSVTVTIKRIAKSAAATVTTICTGSSDNTGNQSKTFAPSGSCFASALDTDAYIYFAVIQIHRGTNAANVAAVAVELF